MATVDDLRRVFRIGMSRDAFYAACDDLLPLKLSLPTVDKNLVAIETADGAKILFFLSDDRGLFYAERDGGVFME